MKSGSEETACMPVRENPLSVNSEQSLHPGVSGE